MSKNEARVEGVWHGETIIVDVKEALIKGFETSADVIMAKARALIPLGPGKPMHLRNTIRKRRGKKDKSSVFIYAGQRRKGVYWHFMQEYGTYNSPAHPFMRPAVDSSFNATVAESMRQGRREINKKRRISTKTRKFYSKFTLG